jgi:hypothetical protein
MRTHGERRVRSGIRVHTHIESEMGQYNGVTGLWAIGLLQLYFSFTSALLMLYWCFTGALLMLDGAVGDRVPQEPAEAVAEAVAGGGGGVTL